MYVINLSKISINPCLWSPLASSFVLKWLWKHCKKWLHKVKKNVCVYMRRSERKGWTHLHSTGRTETGLLLPYHIFQQRSCWSLRTSLTRWNVMVTCFESDQSPAISCGSLREHQHLAKNGEERLCSDSTQTHTEHLSARVPNAFQQCEQLCV